MKTSIVSLATVSLALFATHAARAEPESYVSAGGELGSQIGFMSAATVEGGERLGGSPALLHWGVALGSFSDLNEAVGSNTDTGFLHGAGSFMQARAGIETEHCTTGGRLCGLYGADLGVLRTGATSGPFVMTQSVRYTEEQVIPRIGLDAGGAHLRVRLTLDVTAGLTQRSAPQSRSEAGLQGIALGSALAYRF